MTNLGALAGALTPSGVFIVSSENNEIVNVYASNPDFAWIKVQSSVMVTEGQFLRKKKRTALVKAETEVLNELVELYGTKKPLPGRIYVHEYLESELPEHIRSRFSNSKNGYEAAIADFVKVHSQTKDVMTHNGQRIIRFSEWDMTGQIADISIDKSAPVSAPPAAEPAQQMPLNAEAALPAGDEDLPF